MIKKLCFLLFFTFISSILFGQNQLPSKNIIQNAPYWAQLMYSEHPNVFEIQREYRNYYRTRPFEKNVHTRYYKFWTKSLFGRVKKDGSLLPVSLINIQKTKPNNIGNLQKAGNWSLVGPIQTYDSNGSKSSDQTCVYTIEQSLSNISILYCGTEAGEVFKSSNGGDNWVNVSKDLLLPLNNSYHWNGIRALAIHPTDPNTVFISMDNFILKTTDGGSNWSVVYTHSGWGFDVEKILIHPNQSNTVFVSSRRGLLRSNDGGISWNTVFSDWCYDIEINTASNNIVYALRKNDAQEICEFVSSTDYGLTFSVQSNGWYSSTDPNRQALGGRIAVTQADANRVYAYLIGQSKSGDNGYIGVYRSNDGGSSWTLPNGPIGGPYTNAHPNLASLGMLGTGFFGGLNFCDLIVSNQNADKLLIGSLNLWASDDGALTFIPKGGYVNGPLNGAIHTDRFHVDMQEFYHSSGNTWVASDGGLYKSTDFFSSTTNFEKKNQGIHSTDYWGFGSGWNEDVFYGGLYHNGNLAHYENYGLGNGLALGGGEPSTGYVNPGQNTLIYSSELGGSILPPTIGGNIGSTAFGILPNEDFDTWYGTSELEFDPSCYSTAYTGKDNQLWKTTDKGQTFNLLQSFGSNPYDYVTYIEISRSDPNTMFVCQRSSSSNHPILWKTTDGGLNWNQINLPTLSLGAFMLLQVDPYNPDNIWIALNSNENSSAVYQSTDGGATWQNLTTPTIANRSALNLNYIGGTDGGIYLGTDRGLFYRNNTLPDWENFADGLPATCYARYARPFYRDGKIRLASPKGIWESPFYEPQQGPLAQISVDELEKSLSTCALDTFHFVDHSMLNHAGAIWEWNFYGGNPATATTWKADVVFPNAGNHLVTLKVTDGSGNFDIDSLYVTVNANGLQNTIAEGFQGIFPPPGFEIVNPTNTNITWTLNNSVGGYGQSSQCMYMESYYSVAGSIDDAVITLDMTDALDAALSFDVAYAIWGGQYVDTLQILVTPDCGQTYTEVYNKGASDLATAPANSATPFVPTPSEWRTDVVDLSAFIGNPEVNVIFRLIQGYAQNIYIDNINLDGNYVALLEAVDEYDIYVYPNPVTSGEVIQLQSNFSESITVELFNAKGDQVYFKTHYPNSSIALGNLASGVYFYRLSTSQLIKNGKLVVR